MLIYDESNEPTITDASWLSLRSKVEQCFSIEKTHEEIAGRSLPWFRVADPEQMLCEAASTVETWEAAQSDVTDPFWAGTWRSAIGMDTYLAGVDLQGLAVLELGCGTGRAGTAAALRGAKVTLTDAVPAALKLAELNSWPVRDRVSFEQLSWASCQRLTESFPLIIGSDIVYESSFFADLEECVRAHLEPTGRLLISEPSRSTGDEFQVWMLSRGWHVSVEKVDLTDGKCPIRVFDCNRSTA